MKSLSKPAKVGLIISSIGYIIMIILLLFSKPIPGFVMGIFSTGLFITTGSAIFMSKELKDKL